MLKNLDPILSAPLLAALKEMGHGDEIAVVDTNFPAYAMNGRVLHMPGIAATRVVEAILSLMPLDTFVAAPAATMAQVDGKGPPAIFAEFQAACDKAEGRKVKVEEIDRFAFYERVKKCYALVHSGERRLYGNILLKKGVIGPDA